MSVYTHGHQAVGVGAGQLARPVAGTHPAGSRLHDHLLLSRVHELTLICHTAGWQGGDGPQHGGQSGSVVERDDAQYQQKKAGGMRVHDGNSR